MFYEYINRTTFYNHYGSHLQGISVSEDNTQVDQHSHSDKKVRNEKRIPDELQMIHQRRNVWNESVQYQSCEESPQNSFHSYELHESTWIACWLTQKIYRMSVLERNMMYGLSNAQAAATLAAVLHHMVIVAVKEPAADTREEIDN